MSMAVRFFWQNVHVCVSSVGTNHITFHWSATAWCRGPAGFGSVSHSSCSLMLFVTHLLRLCWCLSAEPFFFRDACEENKTKQAFV